MMGQGSNSGNLRLFNERVILNALRRLGEASKAELARQARLTSNATGQIVHDLEQQGLVRTLGKRNGARGQPATLLALACEGAYAIGVKIGRRTVDTVLVDFAGNVLERVGHEQPFPLPEEAIHLARGGIDRMMQAIPSPAGDRLAGIGVAMPYNMGSWRRELDIPDDAMLAWDSFDVASRLEADTGQAIFVENDGTAAAVAELFGGNGRQVDDFLYVFIGTAIGGGVILGGDFRRGVTGNAGDLGLMPVGRSRLATAPVPSKPFDILLDRASISSLVRHLRGNGVAMASRHDLDQAIERQPALVREWLDDCADALTGPLLAAASLLDVEAVVLDGDLPRHLIDDLLRRLGKGLAAAAAESREPPCLLPGRIGRNAAAIGAAILPLHLSYSPSRKVLLGQRARPTGTGTTRRQAR